jgi:hypothetical protein
VTPVSKNSAGRHARTSGFSTVSPGAAQLSELYPYKAISGTWCWTRRCSHLAIVECGRPVITAEEHGQDSHTESSDRCTHLETSHHPSCPTVGQTRKRGRREPKEGKRITVTKERDLRL